MVQGKKKLISIVGDAFADVYCYLEDNTPEVVVGGDARLSQPMTTRAGGSGINTSTHLRSLINHFGINNDDSAFQLNFQTVINENDVYGKLIASHAKMYGFNFLNRRVSDYPSCFFGTDESMLPGGGKSTGHCAVIVAKGERSFMTHLGCLEDFRGSYILDESMNEIYDLKHVHVSGYFNMPGFWNGELKSKLAQMKQRNKQITVSLVPQHDATETWDGGLLDVLAHVDFLILSENEAKGITKYDKSAGRSFFEYAARYFHDACPNNTHVLITLGSDGCAYLYNGAIEKIATVKKEPIDPTGAGDAFAAGFVYGYLDYMAHQKKDDLCLITSDAIRESVLWGCASGSCCVMINGASLPPEKRIIEQMLNDVRTINETKGVKRPLEER
jgi:sugar/nucleoside kinase (ribokinase family)